MVIGRIFLAMLAACALAAATAFAKEEDDYAEQARANLEAGMAVHEARGYQRDRATHDLVVPLRLERPYLWEINLRSGVNYRIYGACDNDCSDLDMEIYGDDGGLADRDVATDDEPYVQISPTHSGRHYVRLWVFACAPEPCTAAARVVSGGAPSDRQQAVEEAAEVPTGESYVAVVNSELEDAGVGHIAAGYAPWGPDTIVAIALEGEGHRQTVSLEAGRAYLFQGACDQDCSDVDMEIIDPRGRQIAEDIAPDDRPALALSPTRSGDFTVRIWLAQCSVEPCFVGLRGYMR